MNSQRTTLLTFLAGLIIGPVVFYFVLLVSGQTIVHQAYVEEQEARQQLLETELHDLTEELFRPRDSGEIEAVGLELPYDEAIDAAAAVDAARAQAREEGKFLMVTFGANWCLDCRTLSYHLNSDVVTRYTQDLFRFVNVDIGNFNRNRDVAESLGVTLSRGIPVAVFFGPDGNLIGTTNEGQLEPARYFSSRQILKFVRDVAERSLVNAPDSVN